MDNAITNVEFECENLSEDEPWYEEEKSYKIFVLCEDTRINFLQVDGDDGNGYYGSGYTIRVLKTEKGE